MIIVADQNLPLLDQTFGQHAALRLRSGRDIGPADLEGADVLLVKSITPVTADLMEGSGIRFVGSATIGIDHIDTAWLEERGVGWCNAPGCNANAAAQYSLAMIDLALERMGKPLTGCQAGIVGKGNVGSRIMRLLEVMGVTCVACDPPLEANGTPGLVSLKQALDSDIVCLHVPLTRSGPDATWHMLNDETLALIPPGALLLNSARGNVIDGPALLRALHKGRIAAALDVWPDEPKLDPSLLHQSLFASPHIAGYSVQGRLNGVLMIYQAFCRWAGLKPRLTEAPNPGTQVFSISPGQDAISAAIRQSTGVERDDRTMRGQLGNAGGALAGAFDSLRSHYPDRHEFPYWRIEGADGTERRTLKALGFQLPAE